MIWEVSLVITLVAGAAFVIYSSLKKRDATNAEICDNGIRAFQADDYTTAHRLLQFAADSGDSKAQLYLATMHINGLGMPVDYAKIGRAHV